MSYRRAMRNGIWELAALFSIAAIVLYLWSH